jgi:hypothetical protein
MAWSDVDYNWHSGPSDYSDVPSDDARRCQVIGCPKKHGFARVEGGKKIYSKYCPDRACPSAQPAAT